MINSGQPALHTCCCGNLQIRWPLCVCLQVCPGPALHPVPVSATPFYDREEPAVPSPAPVDGLSPSASAEEGDDRQSEMTVMMVCDTREEGRSGVCGRW